MSSRTSLDLTNTCGLDESSSAISGYTMKSTEALSILSIVLVSGAAPLETLHLPRLILTGTNESLAFRKLVSMLSKYGENLKTLTISTGSNPFNYRPVLRALASSLPSLRMLTVRDPAPAFLEALPSAQQHVSILKMRFHEKPIDKETSSIIENTIVSMAVGVDCLEEFHLDARLIKESRHMGAEGVPLEICKTVSSVLLDPRTSKELHEISLKFNGGRGNMEELDDSFARYLKQIRSIVTQARQLQYWESPAVAYIARKARTITVDMNMIMQDAFFSIKELSYAISPSTTFVVRFPEIELSFSPSCNEPVVTGISLLPNLRYVLESTRFDTKLSAVRVPGSCSCLWKIGGRLSAVGIPCAMEDAIAAVKEREDVSSSHSLKLDMEVVSGISAYDAIDHLETALTAFPFVEDLKIDYGFVIQLRHVYHRLAEVFCRTPHLKRLHLMIPSCRSGSKFIPSIDAFLRNVEPFLNMAVTKVVNLESVTLPEGKESVSENVRRRLRGKGVADILKGEDLCRMEGLDGSLRMATKSLHGLTGLSSVFLHVNLFCLIRLASRRVDYLTKLKSELERKTYVFENRLVLRKPSCFKTCPAE